MTSFGDPRHSGFIGSRRHRLRSWMANLLAEFELMKLATAAVCAALGGVAIFCIVFYAMTTQSTISHERGQNDAMRAAFTTFVEQQHEQTPTGNVDAPGADPLSDGKEPDP